MRIRLICTAAGCMCLSRVKVHEYFTLGGVIAGVSAAVCEKVQLVTTFFVLFRPRKNLVVILYSSYIISNSFDQCIYFINMVYTQAAVIMLVVVS